MAKSTLQEKMAAVSKSNLASMVPTPKEKKKKEPEIFRDAAQVVKDKKKRDVIITLADEIRQLGDAMSALTKEKDAKNGVLKALISELGIGEEKFIAGDCKVGMTVSQRKTILEEKLLARGIQPAVIAACMDVKDVYTLRITRVGEDE